MANLYTLERADWTTEKRKQYLKDSPENHAGPNGSFPIADGNDVKDAWNLAGHASDPDAVRAKIKAIAKRLGLTSSLPDTAKEDDDSKERSMGAEHTHAALTRAAANHDPFTGSHSHSHDANDSQGDDETHTHEHSHDNDNSHDHTHSEERARQGISPVNMYVPITRSFTDENGDWIVEGQATSDILDHYDTVFDFESAKKAFKRWRGNVREQHDVHKAVGRAIEWFPDEENHRVTLRSRISKGAPDTWQKVLDDVLTGYSVSLDPRTVKTEMIERAGKRVKKYYDYDYLEVSLVDAPGSPGCEFTIVRADGMITDVLDDSEEPAQQTTPILPESVSSPLERAGARVSSETRTAMHGGIGHTLKAAVSQMKNCNCEDCQAVMKMIDPDADGDIDMGGYDDPDQDWQSLYAGNSDADTERAISGIVERVVEKQFASVYARLQGIAGTLARSNAPLSETTITSAIERAIGAATVANESSLSEVRASLTQQERAMEAVKATVDRIDATPVPGAPIMNANSMPRPALPKQLPTDPMRDPYARPKSSGSSVADAMRQLSESGFLTNQDAQVEAMAAGLLLQRQNGGR